MKIIAYVLYMINYSGGIEPAPAYHYSNNDYLTYAECVEARDISTQIMDEQSQGNYVKYVCIPSFRKD